MQPIHDAVSGALSAVLARAPLSDGKVRFAWRAAVGTSLDRASLVQLTKDGVLRVDVKNQFWRREVERSRTLVARRLDELLGRGVVRRLDVRVRERADSVGQASEDSHA